MQQLLLRLVVGLVLLGDFEGDLRTRDLLLGVTEIGLLLLPLLEEVVTGMSVLTDVIAEQRRFIDGIGDGLAGGSAGFERIAKRFSARPCIGLR